MKIKMASDRTPDVTRRVVPSLATEWSHAPGRTQLTVVPCWWQATLTRRSTYGPPDSEIAARLGGRRPGAKRQGSRPTSRARAARLRAALMTVQKVLTKISLAINLAISAWQSGWRLWRDRVWAINGPRGPERRQPIEGCVCASTARCTGSRPTRASGAAV